MVIVTDSFFLYTMGQRNCQILIVRVISIKKTPDTELLKDRVLVWCLLINTVTFRDYRTREVFFHCSRYLKRPLFRLVSTLTSFIVCLQALTYKIDEVSCNVLQYEIPTEGRRHRTVPQNLSVSSNVLTQVTECTGPDF